ncbi:hypothetical protein [Bacteroides sp. 51]|uniref:hypothetical protein n=1 Tax=Bacteroides sp. 51 TaxID=2302938 RepID=UPI0013D1FDB6|nr:hypothetical protein [Bacteroides sp. 51]NDV82243.1 hypothetical protein [Bacteroides sp. 51]
MKVIITGSTGMVGEGTLLEYLSNPNVEEQFKGYDACFYCAGKSSVRMNEHDYTRTHIRYSHVLRKQLQQNVPRFIPCIAFIISNCWQRNLNQIIL